MAYSYARRRELQVAKLRAAGLEPGTNPRAAWEALDPAAQRYAATRYAREHPDYRGGGPLEVRPTPRARPRRTSRPLHQRVPGTGDIYWTRNWQLVGRLIRGAGRRRMRILARLFVRDLNTGVEGWRQVWVGEPNNYMEALAGPDTPVQVTIGAGGSFPSSRFRRALLEAPTTDGMEPAGRVPVMFRGVTSAGGFRR